MASSGQSSIYIISALKPPIGVNSPVTTHFSTIQPRCPHILVNFLYCPDGEGWEDELTEILLDENDKLGVVVGEVCEGLW